MDYVRRILRDQEERRRGPESRRRDAGESRRRDDGLRDITVCVDITFLILSADANVRDDGLRRYNGLRRQKKPPNKRNSVEHPARGGEPPKTSLHMPVAAGESRRRDDGLRRYNLTRRRFASI